MKIIVLGNPEMDSDALPLKILPRLKKEFQEIEFAVVDPNEEWEIPENLVMMDTVECIDQVTTFNDLSSFSVAPHVTMHDFDAYANLKLLEKLGKLKKIKIIGVPPAISEEEAIKQIVPTIHSTALLKNARRSSCKDHRPE
ncbi:MAG TPA: hypothetical protein VJC20_01605 [Candidatus Paceibacterota bacterium]